MTPDVPDRIGCEMCERVDKSLILDRLARNAVVPLALVEDYNRWALMLAGGAS
jgi:hypothetical protein